MYYSPELDMYFNNIEEFYDVAIEQGNIPEFIYGTKKFYGDVPDEIDVARMINEQFIYNWLIDGTADHVAELFIESLDCDYPEVFTCKGIEQLQEIIEWFAFWNKGIFRFCDLMDIEFNLRWCIGINTLQGALETFAKANKDICVWNYDMKNKIAVDAED